MKKAIKVHSLTNNSPSDEYIELSSFCPCCGVRLLPEVLYASLIEYDNEENNKLFLLNYCPECDECFISRHLFDSIECDGYFFESASPMAHFKQAFSKEICVLSPDFISIYNESLYAEELGLDSICGMGYRKSLEFLIKDYIIHKNPSEKDNVVSKQLMHCINDYISDSRLKSLAKASTWLGNDETHYVKKHGNYGIQDLKSFINAFVTFIAADLACEDALNLISRQDLRFFSNHFPILLPVTNRNSYWVFFCSIAFFCFSFNNFN